MSYSFTVKKATKQQAADEVFVKLTEVCEQQPVHAVDAEIANVAAKEIIAMVAEDETKDVQVDMNGSIFTTAAGVQQVSMSINAYLCNKDKPIVV